MNLMQKRAISPMLVLAVAIMASAVAPSRGELPDLGANSSLNGNRPFPDDNPWNQRVDQLPVDPNSDALIDSIGRNVGLHPDFGANWDGGPFGIPYVVVSGDTSKVPVTFDYADESDPGPYPIPPNPPIEKGSDAHLLIIDRDNWVLYEIYAASQNNDGSWSAGSGAIFDLKTNDLRPAGWTSADAAGLPIFPGLARYDEVYERKEIDHALRFTAKKTRKAYVYPARHYASSNADSSLPPMGMRVRLKADFDISGFPPDAQVILKALKAYGMILADNGSNWFISGAPDSRWSDDDMNALKRVTGNSLEVTLMNSADGPATTPMIGDLNGDGKVNVQDVTLSLRIATGEIQPTDAQKIADDANDDGILNVQDAIQILRYAVGMIASLPVK